MEYVPLHVAFPPRNFCHHVDSGASSQNISIIAEPISLQAMCINIIYFTHKQMEGNCVTNISPLTTFSTSLSCFKMAENISTSQPKAKKRSDYLEWDEYFMALAFLSAQRSKDPSTQVGACIVNKSKKIVGIGYNGMPNGCDDDEMPWDRTGDWSNTKYPYVCHAELNAILNKNSSDVQNCTIYVALFPCNECAKLIIQSGISLVIYYSDKYHEDKIMKASRTLLDKAGVGYRQFQPKMKQIVIDFECIDGKKMSPHDSPLRPLQQSSATNI
ncbi:DCTD [Bugula neritina]|uniref:dCMP deaminase n=1 Tax=Bugula neritina TaxID=10212 RepID=A0A7J7K0Z4_BUGNE|nr:DCTD [Bugula neritina]